MERAGRITDSFPRRHRARTRTDGKERSGTRRGRGAEGRHREVPPAPPPPNPPRAEPEDARDPPAPTREAPRELLEMLRRFDLAWEYGPCSGITRLQRWERARALGLSPPAAVRDALLEHRDDPAVTYSLWHEYGLAMRILTCPAHLQHLEDALRSSLPHALPVYGAVLNINRGNPGDFEVAVDAWPNFGAVLARRRGEAPLNDSYRNLCSAFYRDVGAYRALLESPGCLRWDSAFHIFGLQDGVLTVSQDIALAKGVELEVTEFYTYLHPDPSTLPEPQLDPDVQLGTLSPAHVELLNSTWPYGGNVWSRRYLGELLRRFPHLCLQDPAGNLLGWMLTNGFAAGTHGYIVPTQRRRGLMRALTIMAARQAHGRGFPVYGHTATDNRAMQRLLEELGHRRLPGLCYFVLYNPALARAAPGAPSGRNA